MTSANINSKSIRTIITEFVNVKMEEYNVLGETCVRLIYSEPNFVLMFLYIIVIKTYN